MPQKGEAPKDNKNDSKKSDSNETFLDSENARRDDDDTIEIVYADEYVEYEEDGDEEDLEDSEEEEEENPALGNRPRFASPFPQPPFPQNFRPAPPRGMYPPPPFPPPPFPRPPFGIQRPFPMGQPFPPEFGRVPEYEYYVEEVEYYGDAQNPEPEDEENFDDKRKIFSNQSYLNGKGAGEFPRATEMPNLKSISAMRSKRADEMQMEGSKRAISNEKLFYLSKLWFLARSLFTLTIIAALIGGCFLLVKMYFDKISERGMITKATSDESPITTNADRNWILPNSLTGITLKSFYSTLGNIDKIAANPDMLAKGTIHRDGKKEEIYCIKRNDSFFLKIGSGKSERTYLIGTPKDGACHLKEGKISGDKEYLSTADSVALLSIVMFDEPIFSRAFSPTDAALRTPLTPIKYIGKKTVSDKSCTQLEISEGEAVITYLIEDESSLIRACEISFPNRNIAIYYSNYSEVDGIKAPEKREIFVNDKSFAKVNFDFMVRNRGIIFPQ